MNTDSSIKNAMVLAAGLGTRMRPITDTIPKPLVEVNGKTLLDHALDALAGAGVTVAAVNVHYLAEQIEAHLEKRHKPATLISDERAELLDSGGGVKQAIKPLEEGGFFILNADSFWIDRQTQNLIAMAEAWDEDKMDMMLLVCTKDAAVGFDGAGDFFRDESGKLSRRGTADSAPFIYAGAIIAKKEKFMAVEESKFSLNRLFDEAIAADRLYSTVLDGLWLHVGTPPAIGEAETAIARYDAEA